MCSLAPPSPPRRHYSHTGTSKERCAKARTGLLIYTAQVGRVQALAASNAGARRLLWEPRSSGALSRNGTPPPTPMLTPASPPFQPCPHPCPPPHRAQILAELDVRFSWPMDQPGDGGGGSSARLPPSRNGDLQQHGGSGALQGPHGRTSSGGCGGEGQPPAGGGGQGPGQPPDTPVGRSSSQGEDMTRAQLQASTPLRLAGMSTAPQGATPRSSRLGSTLTPTAAGRAVMAQATGAQAPGGGGPSQTRVVDTRIP